MNDPIAGDQRSGTRGPRAPGLAERIGAFARSRAALVGLLVVVFLLLWLVALTRDIAFEQLLSLTVWGLLIGGILALGSIGLTLIYGVVKFPNFSHGALITLGAYLAFAVMSFFPKESTLGPFSFGWEFLVSLLVVMPVVGVVAVAVDKVIYRRLRNQNAALVLFAMASLGMAFFLRSVIYLAWGSDFHFYYVGRPNPAIDLPLGVRVQSDQLFTFVLALILVLGTWLLLTRTRIGKSMRATADNPELAQVRGINTERVIAWTWLMSGMLAAACGVMYGLVSQIRPEMGFYLLLPIFAGTILGGIGNPFGAFVGAMIIGVVQQVTAAFISPAYGPAVAFILMVVVLVVRPQGLFGQSGG